MMIGEHRVREFLGQRTHLEMSGFKQVAQKLVLTLKQHFFLSRTIYLHCHDGISEKLINTI